MTSSASKPTRDSDARRRALSRAALLMAVVAPLAYMLQRAFELTLNHGATPNPASILRSAHAAFYWRAMTASWWAGLLAIAAWRWLQTRESDEPEVMLGRLALAWAVLIPGLALWLP